MPLLNEFDTETLADNDADELNESSDLGLPFAQLNDQCPFSFSSFSNFTARCLHVPLKPSGRISSLFLLHRNIRI